MGIEVSAPVAGVGGGALVAGGGTLALLGRRQLTAATAMSQFATPSQVVPTLRQLDRTLAATDQVLTGVHTAMSAARLPGEGLLRRVPFLGSAADDLERAVRLGAAAKELAKVDETVLIGSARQLNTHTAQLVAAAEADVARLATAKASAMSGGTKLLVGGALAAAGAFLLANAIFDFD